MLNNNSKEELEKVMKKVLEELRKYGVNYFYRDNPNELLIKGDVLVLSDNHAFIKYDDDLWGWHYDVMLERKPEEKKSSSQYLPRKSTMRCRTLGLNFSHEV